MLNQIALWFDQNYEKIWLMVCVFAILFVVLGSLIGNDVVYDIGDTATDFYDEILSE